MGRFANPGERITSVDGLGIRARSVLEEPLANDLLTALWIVPAGRQGPLGFGVNDHSVDDALAVVRSQP
jgi:hypothetical protein